MEDECPGCLDCGDKCDIWDGEHLWVEFPFYLNPDGTDTYSQCDFCGKKD